VDFCPLPNITIFTTTPHWTLQRSKWRLPKHWHSTSSFVWLILIIYCLLLRGGVVIEALRYKPEGREFDSWWCHGIFYWHNPSGRTMALGSIQPLTEMSTRNISWGKGGRCVGLRTLQLRVPIVLKSGSLNPLEISGPVKACNENALPLPLLSTLQSFKRSLPLRPTD
jgi:hypothetical protein